MIRVIRSSLVAVGAFLLAGCCCFPARVAMPLRTTVLDSETGAPIAGAHVVRFVGDVHDRQCQRSTIEQLETDESGLVAAPGRRKWGLWVPAPGLLPVPNHQIAVWKEGYYVWTYSQYGHLDDLLTWRRPDDRKDIIEVLSRIPPQRKEMDPTLDPNKVLNGGTIRLQKLKNEDANKALEASVAGVLQSQR